MTIAKLPQTVVEAARARWNFASPYRLGILVGEMGLALENPYSGERAARNFADGVTYGMSDDPMERIVAIALNDAGIDYVRDYGGENPSGLDFRLANGIEIEVKRFHSPRIADQMARAENVIAVQGKEAVEFFAGLLRSGSSA